MPLNVWCLQSEVTPCHTLAYLAITHQIVPPSHQIHLKAGDPVSFQSFMGKSIEDNCLNQWIGLGARTQMVMRTATLMMTMIMRRMIENH